MFLSIFRRTPHLPVLALALLTCAWASGCGGNRATVQGTVTLDSQPLEGGRIFFLPEGEPVGRPAVHATIEEGKYYLPAAQGPQFGKHRVEIVWHKQPPGKEHLKQGDPGFTTDNLIQVIPAVYNSKTTLSAEVQPGTNTFNFTLKKKL